MQWWLPISECSPLNLIFLHCAQPPLRCRVLLLLAPFHILRMEALGMEINPGIRLHVKCRSFAGYLPRCHSDGIMPVRSIFHRAVSVRSDPDSRLGTYIRPRPTCSLRIEGGCCNCIRCKSPHTPCCSRDRPRVNKCTLALLCARRAGVLGHVAQSPATWLWSIRCHCGSVRPSFCYQCQLSAN